MENGKAELFKNHKKEVNKLPHLPHYSVISISTALLEYIRNDIAREQGLFTWKMQ